jgi:hypothetical protein
VIPHFRSYLVAYINLRFRFRPRMFVSPADSAVRFPRVTSIMCRKSRARCADRSERISRDLPTATGRDMGKEEFQSIPIASNRTWPMAFLQDGLETTEEFCSSNLAFAQ